MYSLWGVVYVTRTLALLFVTSLFLLGHCDMKQTSSITISCLTHARAHAHAHTHKKKKRAATAFSNGFCSPQKCFISLPAFSLSCQLSPALIMEPNTVMGVLKTMKLFYMDKSQ